MMKKTMINTVLAAAVFLSVAVGQGGVSATAATAKPAVTAKPAATVAPVMRDNLSKYGLKKDVELPVTITAGGLSYTLEKIMIYDFKAPEVKNLQKLYGFQNSGLLFTNPKYFIWTKVTITNNTKQTLTGSGNTIANTMLLRFEDGKILDAIWPMNKRKQTNDQEALWTYKLAPGQKITSYLAYGYEGDFNYFVLRMFFGGFVEKYVVNQ